MVLLTHRFGVEWLSGRKVGVGLPCAVDSMSFAVLCHALQFKALGHARAADPQELHTSTLMRTGDAKHTAMALTVGLPAAIATELILTGRSIPKTNVLCQ